MTNYEKYEQEIKEIILKGGGIACVGGTPAMCQDTKCGECDFNSSCRACFNERKNWLNAEYKEPITLTEREHAFCVAVGRGWIARDKNGALYIYTDKPRRNNSVDGWCLPTENNWNKIYGISNKFIPEFNLIQWSDEPYSIEELLKMPVKESE